MSKRTKYTAEEKYEIIKAYEEGIESIARIASMYKISEDTFQKWRYNYCKYGINGLRESKTWKRYSKELKEQAIKDQLSGEYSQREIAQYCAAHGNEET